MPMVLQGERFVMQDAVPIRRLYVYSAAADSPTPPPVETRRLGSYGARTGIAQDRFCQLEEANLISSLAAGWDRTMHYPVIDLDYPCEIVEAGGRDGRDLLRMPRALTPGAARRLARWLVSVGIIQHATDLHVEENQSIAITLACPAQLVPSRTPGHFHLYLDHLIPHREYFDILEVMATIGLIEVGYFRASIGKGYSAVRIPQAVREGRERGANDSA